MKHVLLFFFCLASFSAMAGNTRAHNGNDDISILYVNTNANGINNGTSWANAYKTLHEALANVGDGITQIWVARGTYHALENGQRITMKNNVAIYGGFAGTETQLSERNWKINETILSGEAGVEGIASDNVANVIFNFQVLLDHTAILDGFTVSGGYSDGNPGGAIYNYGASCTIANCTFKDNYGNDGGAIGNEYCDPIITNCIFIRNHGIGGDLFAGGSGGGIYNAFGSPIITNCSFIENSARDGGGIFNLEAAPIINNCSFSGNTVIDDNFFHRAIANHNSFGTITNCILWDAGSNEIGLDFNTTISYSIVRGGANGVGIKDEDPQFVSTADLHLQLGSPAIDAGDDAAFSNSIDLDGNSRKFDAIAGGTLIDMGAYEFGSSTPACTDEIAPAFTGSYADVNLGCNPANPEGSLGTATATDESGTVTITSSDGSVVSDGCNFSKTRTFTAIDGCNNTATTSRTVRWIVDLTPPAFTGSYAEVSLGCNPADPIASLGAATATDACGAVTITHVDGSVMSDGCNRSTSRTFIAKDGCNNTATTSRTVRWIDDVIPPVFTGSYADVDLGCKPAYPSGSLGNASATDVCGAVTITSQDGSVISDGCNRSITRTFTAKDGCNNTSTTSRTVRWTADNTLATFTGSYADVDLGCNPAYPSGSLGSATATDGCGAVTITSQDGSVVSNGCNRSIIRTFTAKDGCNNTSTASRTVRWIADLTPPSFTGSYADVDLGCNAAYPTGSLGTATATDVCGTVTINSQDASVVSNGCNRSITRTFTAKDGCNNMSTTSRTVRWTADLTPPAFTGSYADINLDCNPADPNGSLGSATATDGCGAVTITSQDGSVVSNGCNRSRTRTFTAKDGCNNTSTTSRTVRWINDVTAPTLVCAKTGTVTKSTNAGLCTYAVDGIEFDPSVSDVCSTPSLGWTVSGATTTSGTTTMAGTQLNFGYNTIKWTATDGCGNISTCSFIVHVNKVTTTTSLVVSTNPVTDPVTQQYSDKITCVATVTPANCAGAGPIGGTVTFKIINAQGTVVLGTAPVASDGTATLTDTLLENQFYPGATNLLPSNGPLKPGNKIVTAEYSGTDPDYIVTNPTAPLVVTCEDAEITYNGLNYFGANPTTNQGTITVSAFVLDTNDVNDSPPQARGDIRNATITFKEGSSAGTVIGSSNIPVGLVNPINFQEGIVTTNKTYTLTTQEISYGGKIVDVWAGVNNYYCGEVAEVVPVCISLPGGDFVTGGGWIKMLNSEGSYAGTDDKKMHVAIVFKWNKSNKNLQGNATIIYKRVVNGVQKVYQIKSNSITSMIVNNVNDAGTAVITGATYRMAQIVTKANFRDLTDPDFPITLFGNLTLTITAWESIGATNGSQDRISVQLIGSGSQGLIFSSNWVNGATQWQQLNSGKMRVRNPSSEIPCTNCSGSGITAKPGEMDKATEVLPDEDLKVGAMPNPSSTNFRIAISSKDLKDPIKIIVSDMFGRVIETRITTPGQIITIGDRYRSGTYALRILQGKKIRQLKLIKIPD